MDNSKKFLLPSPIFNKKTKVASVVKPDYLTLLGMTLNARDRLTPMYGKHGSTYSNRYLNNKSTSDVTIDIIKPMERQLCESCDMELQTLDDFRRHCAQHESCPVDGCGHRCHPTIMDKHVGALHTSGLFEQCKKLSTPEEIAAWREERRRKYPSVKNVLMRQRAVEQRQQRGERLELSKSRFGKIEDRKRAKMNTETYYDTSKVGSYEQMAHKKNKNNKNSVYKVRKDNKRRRKIEFQSTKQFNQVATVVQEIFEDIDSICAKEPVEQSCCDVLMFRGTSHLRDYKHMKYKRKEVNALTNFLGMYGTDDEVDQLDSENEGDTEQTTNISKTADLPVSQVTEVLTPVMITRSDNMINQQLESKIIKWTEQEENLQKVKNLDVVFSSIQNFNTKLMTEEQMNSSAPAENMNTESGDESPREVPIDRISHLTSPPPQRTQEESVESSLCSRLDQQYIKSDKIYKQTSGLNYRKTCLRKQNTMLRKLLESDIRHERNVLLQCVRYVCERNFFNVGQNLY